MDTVISWTPTNLVWPAPVATATEAVEDTVQEGATLMSVVQEETEPQRQTDEGLMLQVVDGSRDALSELYARHSRGCFGLAMKIVHDPFLAEEIVQDVFMKLWSAPTRFTPARGKFSGWLLTLVHNRSVDKLRRIRAGLGANTVPLDLSKDGETSLAEMLADGSEGPLDEVWRAEKGRIVRGVLDKLPEPQRQTLTLAYFEGLTQREIAEVLRQPIGTIKTRTRSALLSMRRLLAGQNLLGESD